MSSLARQCEGIETIAVKENMQSNNVNITNSDGISKNDKGGTSNDATLKKAPPSNPQSLLPTYESSEDSVYYKSAKALLQSGDFETALSTIEEGIEWTKQQLSIHRVGSNEDENCLHESMAPFHYLYGTTLLYSVEESTDGVQPLTTVEGGITTIPEEGDENSEEYEGVHCSNEAAPETEEPQGDNVEDMEIAWENLDTARNILEHMLTLQPTSDKLRADMAQILLREGDLQRQNGAHTAAVTDYTSCLSYYENNVLIPPFCRKIADVHCNLGAVYFNLVVETKKGADTQDMNGTTIEIQERDRPAKIIFYRNRGFHHYYECAKTLVGMISELVQTKPYELFHRVETEHAARYSYCNERSDDYPKSIRAKLTKLRQLTITMITLKSNCSVSWTVEDTDLIRDSLAVLEEIQETIDEAEKSEQGVVELTAMKEEISALVASQQDDVGNGLSTATGSGNAFGSASAAASTAVAQPINMIVKKKKKKRTEKESMDEDGMDVKLPAKDDGNKKRMKSNE